MYFELPGFLRSVSAYLFDLVFLLLLTDWRYPRRKTFLLAGGFFGAVSLFNLVLRCAVPWNGRSMLAFLAVSAAADVLFAFLISRGRDGRAAFSAVSALLFCVVVGGMDFILFWFSPADLGQFFLNLTLRPLFCLYLLRLRKPLFQLMADVPKGWGLLSLIPGVCYLLYLFLTLLPSPLSERRENVPAVFLLDAAVFLIYSSFCSIFSRLRKQHRSEQDSMVAALKMEALEKQVEAFSETEDEMKKFHHDLRHFVRILSVCMQNGEYEEAQSILAKMDQNSGMVLTEKLAFTYSNDAAVNAVLAYYCEAAGKTGMDIQAALDLPSDLSMDRADLSVMLANALENAVLACGNIPRGGVRKIRLAGAPAHGQYLITLSNTYSGTVEFDPETGLPLSRRPGHGTGTKSIRELARKNGAQADFSAENGVFRLHLLL